MEYTLSGVRDLAIRCINSPGDECISELKGILLNSEDSKIRNIIALAFIDINDPTILPCLIDVIERRSTYGHRATLVFACENFDCTSYFNLFFNLALYDKNMASINSIEIIGKMSFDEIEYSIVNYIEVLKKFLVINKDKTRNTFLNKLLYFLKQKNNSKFPYKEFVYLNIFE